MALDYKPSEDFVVNNLSPLVDFDVSDSTELWLIQCPMSQFPEIDGKELKVKLDQNGVLGGFEDSSGKEIDIVSFDSQDADATVIIPSGEESRIVGKISRRVSFVRYPEPKELLEKMKTKTQQKLVGAVTNSSAGKFSNQAQSSRHKTGQSSLRHSVSARSSRQKSIVSGLTDTPMSSKRKHPGSSSGKHHRSTTTTVSGSSDRSGKSKKKVKTEK